jgi:hypothetical protein
MVDLREPMVARVVGPAPGTVVDGNIAIPIRLEALACPAFLSVPKTKEIPIGETINVRIDDVDTSLSVITCFLA